MYRLPSSVFMVLVTVLLMICLAFGVFWLNARAVEKAIAQDAILRVTSWVEYVSSTFPEIESILVDKELSDEKMDFIRQLQGRGKIIGFRIFDEAGNQVLSDIENKGALQQHSPEAYQAIRSKNAYSRLNHGRPDDGYPKLYVEVFFPLTSESGEVLGGVEVYLDQSGTGSIYRQAITSVSTYISLILTFAFLVPVLAFYWRSEQARDSHKKLSYLSHHDPLTGAYNREGFFGEYAGRESSLLSEGRFYSVVLMDIRNFKYVNKEYGQQTGDILLTRIINRLTEYLDSESIVARFSADKFHVAIPLDDHRILEEVIVDLIHRIQMPYHVNGRSISIYINVGACSCHEEPLGVDIKIQRAELALFNARMSVGESYCIYHRDIEDQVLRRRMIEKLLRTGQEQERFEIHYQPVLDARQRSLKGFEALLRLKDDQGNLISPSEFIPMAESIGLIDGIGQWVIKEVLHKAVSWPEHIFVAINLSVVQFQTGHLVGYVRDALATSSISPERIEFEVTESVMIDNSDDVRQQILALQSLGIRFSVDDFGTGFSSLNYLWMFQFNKLKIDRSFVSALSSNEEKAIQILSTIILLAHRLKLQVTAEGIESEHHVEILEDLGCDQFQGYWFYHPLPESKVDQLINDL
ncbi:putative bifunctional diguanylate cyclase/phosphodiesterase [Gynuella sunshinyii]|uniref:Putative signal transduction protein containing a membrane domain, an EAL and a GGDEF domain n=1 Tax=Gynuella sunshinyii YC6258 TaxID=1445510 RepID=A0A0C5VH60_9GAMM|nr:GGDEF domain-containing protein [Gynuella sunshinyii]AJQ93576.1 putative signal transduction protein containing a membrane domain, an EAL and a GGDEF domain [Gynuella sunshinyii YC6258]